MIPVRAAVVSLLLLAAPAWAGGIRGECDIRFLADSTLHDFWGNARCLPLSAGLTKGPDGGTVIPSVEVEIPVDGMDTGNEDRDAQMRKMFQGDRFPRIHGTIRDVNIDAVRRQIANEGKAVLDLALRIRDVERKVPATVTALKEKDGRVKFDVAFPVSLKDFGLKAPRFLFIRVHDRVEVRGNVRLEVSS